MSLQPQAIPPIPEETRRVARAILPKDPLLSRVSCSNERKRESENEAAGTEESFN